MPYLDDRSPFWIRIYRKEKKPEFQETMTTCRRCTAPARLYPTPSGCRLAGCSCGACSSGAHRFVYVTGPRFANEWPLIGSATIMLIVRGWVGMVEKQSLAVLERRIRYHHERAKRYASRTAQMTTGAMITAMTIADPPRLQISADLSVHTHPRSCMTHPERTVTRAVRGSGRRDFCSVQIGG
mgnify:CR=1 FL=1